MDKDKALPSATQLDNVEPATRLLEKRRLMYENQEKYMNKKKEFQQAEIHFRTKEKELREQDQSIQESLISFAAYLDVNQKTIKKSEDNIAKLEAHNKDKRKQIEGQRAKFEILKHQHASMTVEIKEVEIYQKFLEKVREENSDEYSEINDVLSRYKVLTSSRKDLEKKRNNMSD